MKYFHKHIAHYIINYDHYNNINNIQRQVIGYILSTNRKRRTFLKTQYRERDKYQLMFNNVLLSDSDLLYTNTPHVFARLYHDFALILQFLNQISQNVRYLYFDVYHIFDTSNLLCPLQRASTVKHFQQHIKKPTIMMTRRRRKKKKRRRNRYRRSISVLILIPIPIMMTTTTTTTTTRKRRRKRRKKKKRKKKKTRRNRYRGSISVLISIPIPIVMTRRRRRRKKKRRNHDILYS